MEIQDWDQYRCHTHKTKTKPPSNDTGITYILRGFSGTLGHEVLPDSNTSC